jgi:hypothetical protein
MYKKVNLHYFFSGIVCWQRHAQWLYDKCDIIISDKVALQTDTYTKKLSMSSESWPWIVCREIMDWYPKILKMTILDWEGKDKGLYKRCLDAWTNISFLAVLISDGCDGNETAWAAHAAELDNAGADFLESFIAVSTKEAVPSPYLHALAYHLGDMVRRWGSINLVQLAGMRVTSSVDQDLREAQQQKAAGQNLRNQHRCSRESGASRWSCNKVFVIWQKKDCNWSYEQTKEGEAHGGKGSGN